MRDLFSDNFWKHFSILWILAIFSQQMVCLGKCLLEMETNPSRKWRILLSCKGFACWGNKIWKPLADPSPVHLRWIVRNNSHAPLFILLIGTTWVHFFLSLIIVCSSHRATTAPNTPQIFCGRACGVVRRAACCCCQQGLPAPLVHHKGRLIPSSITEHTLSLSMWLIERMPHYWNSGEQMYRSGTSWCIKAADKHPGLQLCLACHTVSIWVSLPQHILDLFIHCWVQLSLCYIRFVQRCVLSSSLQKSRAKPH